MKVLDCLPPASRAEVLGIARSIVGTLGEAEFRAEVCRVLIEESLMPADEVLAAVDEVFQLVRPGATG